MNEKKSRFAFIDQFRGWAVIFMIEAHVLNTFLRLDLRATAGYRIIDFFNGLIAPSFLFLAGFSFAISTMRRWEEVINIGPAFRHQLYRYLLILGIGYGLHIPHYSFRTLFAQTHWWQNSLFWGIDILHCIAVSLVLMLLLSLLLRRPSLLFGFLCITGIAISLLSPLIRSLPVSSRIPAAFVGGFKRVPYSQFPLFPWMGYVFLGAACSFIWQRFRYREKERLFFGYLMAGAGFMSFALVLFLSQAPYLFNLMDFNPLHPQFFFFKLGLLLMLLAFFRWLEEKRQDRPTGVTIMGRLSLLAYTFHIVVIYGPFLHGFKYALSFVLGKRHSPLVVAIMTLLLIALTMAVCLAWNWIKQRRPALARPILFSTLALALLFLSLR